MTILFSSIKDAFSENVIFKNIAYMPVIIRKHKNLFILDAGSYKILTTSLVEIRSKIKEAINENK